MADINKIEKGTIYQNMNKMMNLDGFGFAKDKEPEAERAKIIIKGNSPEEIHRKGLEIEQKKALQDKFFRTTDRGFQKALQYEAARLPAYIDYEGMEYYPIISSALDLFMEECTTIGFNGKMLNVYSNKERIRGLLEEFLYSIINVNVNLPFWVRNTVKYGDNFVLMYGEKKKGITHVKQMVNYEIERFERITGGKPLVKFKERMTGDEFNVFEIAHFRLLGDDKYLPYGSSVLNKVRRVFRQLIMAEDAMLTYRIIRAGEKKVFKIDVGNIDEDDIEEYIYKVATKFKKTQQVAANDGQIDYRFNIMGNDEDYFLPVRNANTQTGIDTLPGASNLDAIQDIEYLRDNLFVGLGIPKPFLSFQDASGAGKNMAQYDIRFSKKVNRIQQAMIQELNKMCMIHLYLLGYSGADISDFTLTLTNPSTQQDLMKAELFREKAQTYTELTRGENGISAMSHTGAKRMLFNMSDSEIVEDLKQQKMEKVIMQELADSPVTIKKTGLFADIDKRYSEDQGALPPPEAGSPEGGPGGGAPAPAGGGGLPPPTGSEEAGGGTPAPGLPNQSPNELPPIKEGDDSNKQRLTEDEYNQQVEKLVFGTNQNIDNNKKANSRNRILIKENEKLNNALNTNAFDMIEEIDKLVSKSKDVDKVFIINENIDDITLTPLTELDLDESEK